MYLGEPLMMGGQVCKANERSVRGNMGWQASRV